MQKLINGNYVDCEKEDIASGDIYRISVGNGGWQQQEYQELLSENPIRKITTGAMQRRFTIPEEVFITSDPAATVIKSRLLNSSYCDLDFQDTIGGVNYICEALQSGGVITDSSVRSSEILRDGVDEEGL